MGDRRAPAPDEQRGDAESADRRGRPSDTADAGAVPLSRRCRACADRAHARLFRRDEARERVARRDSDRSSDSARASRAIPASAPSPRPALEPRAIGAVMPGGATSERQFSNSTSTPCSRSVGASSAGQPLGARDGEHAQRAGLDLRRELRQAVDAHRHLAAEDRRHRLAAARERDVVDAPRRHADGVGDQAGQDLIAAAGRSAAPRDRFGPRRTRRQVAQRAERRCRGHDDDLVLAGEPRDRRDVAQRDRRSMRDDRRRA